MARFRSERGQTSPEYVELVTEAGLVGFDFSEVVWSG
jgi:hypothetical protein